MALLSFNQDLRNETVGYEDNKRLNTSVLVNIFWLSFMLVYDPSTIFADPD